MHTNSVMIVKTIKLINLSIKIQKKEKRMYICKKYSIKKNEKEKSSS